MELQNDIYVLSLTHWDREWRFPFERTRMLLVEMMDELLRVLDDDPDYRTFHLDGQTVLLDDYCDVRPEMADKIRIRNQELFLFRTQVCDAFPIRLDHLAFPSQPELVQLPDKRSKTGRQSNERGHHENGDCTPR